MTDETTDAEGRKPFATWLHEQRAGAAEAEWADALAQLVEAVTTFGKPGEMTVKITMKPLGDGTALEIADDIRLKLPTAPRGASLFFATSNNNLSREDPRQTSLPLREVPPLPTSKEA